MSALPIGVPSTTNHHQALALEQARQLCRLIESPGFDPDNDIDLRRCDALKNSVAMLRNQGANKQ